MLVNFSKKYVLKISFLKCREMRTVAYCMIYIRDSMHTSQNADRKVENGHTVDKAADKQARRRYQGPDNGYSSTAILVYERTHNRPC